MALLATRFIRGGSSKIGPVALDCEVSTDLSISATFSERRIANGQNVSDHSQNDPDEITITGIVDSLSPLTGIGLVSYATGQFLQHERLAELVRSRDELLIVCQRGRFRVTARKYSVQDNRGTGFSTQFTLTCKAVLRGNVKVLQIPTNASAAMNGAGQASAQGATGGTAVSF